MEDPSFLNWYRVMNMECFPLLRLILRSAGYPRHRFVPLNLVSTLGPSLGVGGGGGGADQNIVMGRVPL